MEYFAWHRLLPQCSNYSRSGFRQEFCSLDPLATDHEPRSLSKDKSATIDRLGLASQQICEGRFY